MGNPGPYLGVWGEHGKLRKETTTQFYMFYETATLQESNGLKLHGKANFKAYIAYNP